MRCGGVLIMMMIRMMLWNSVATSGCRASSRKATSMSNNAAFVLRNERRKTSLGISKSMITTTTRTTTTIHPNGMATTTRTTRSDSNRNRKVRCSSSLLCCSYDGFYGTGRRRRGHVWNFQHEGLYSSLFLQKQQPQCHNNCLYSTKTSQTEGTTTINTKTTTKITNNDHPKTKNNHKATMYSITEPGMDPIILTKTLSKHYNHLQRFVQNRDIAAHTKEAFDILQDIVYTNIIDNQQDQYEQKEEKEQQLVVPIILDSGCGTGRSTLHLGRMYPNHVVIGIDKSVSRLNQNSNFRRHSNNSTTTNTTAASTTTKIKEGNISQRKTSDYDTMKMKDGNQTLVVQMESNVYFVRADLVDFWRLLWLSIHGTTTTETNNSHSDPKKNTYEEEKGNNCKKRLKFFLDEHYILYPNPYPKIRQYKSRWYGHPIFPIVSTLGCNKIIVRSNWKAYLQDFIFAMKYSSSNFSQKTILDQIVLQQDDATFNTDTKDTENNNDIQESSPLIGYHHNGPTRIDPTKVDVAWTNFEQKYFTVGEPAYEVVFSIVEDEKP